MTSESSPGPQADVEFGLPPAPVRRRAILDRLAQLGFTVQTFDHPPAYTVADSHAVSAAVAGAHTKNLFLKDAGGALVLVVAKDDTRVDLKGLPRRIGCGRLSFAPAGLLADVLGVPPGSVTVFALVNDPAHRVRLVLDRRLMAWDIINAHPLDNTATTSIARDDLLRFIAACGHQPTTLALDADA